MCAAERREREREREDWLKSLKSLKEFSLSHVKGWENYREREREKERAREREKAREREREGFIRNFHR
jgi:hypothetical protein